MLDLNFISSGCRNFEFSSIHDYRNNRQYSVYSLRMSPHNFLRMTA